jgi:hypothetical protein
VRLDSTDEPLAKPLRCGNLSHVATGYWGRKLLDAVSPGESILGWRGSPADARSPSFFNYVGAFFGVSQLTSPGLVLRKVIVASVQQFATLDL